MKLFRILWIIGVAFLSSCVGDLDTLPLNENDYTSEIAYGAEEGAYMSGLARMYFNFVSNDTSDLQEGLDAGASELNRAFWSIQEVTTDAAKCGWGNDAWVMAANTNTWSDANNDATYSVYVRTMQGIAYVNEYLRQTSGDKLSSRGVSSELASKIDGFRAEARFVRAYLYWIAMDVFGNVPFTTEDSPIGGGFAPSQKLRAEVFQYCVDELTELAAGSDMPAARSNYPRADKGSVMGLLARMYLNAEVYTGQEMWSEAKAACETIFGMGYSLAPTYAELFRGDNGENPDARGEFLFAVSYDAEDTQSNGGTTFLTRGSVQGPELIVGTMSGNWGGNRTTFEFVDKYYGVESADYVTGEYTLATNDARGQIFWIKDRVQSIEDALYTFFHGWSCIKWSNVPHDMEWEEFTEVAATKAYGDVDMPLIRLGEIYLIYAEACMELGQAALAAPKMEELAERAGVDFDGVINQEFLIAERAKELMWEGHRRTDLIRWGKFTDAGFLWPYKGGPFAGQGFADYMEIFAIPASELGSNPNLVQNPGYGKAN